MDIAKVIEAVSKIYGRHQNLKMKYKINSP